MNNKKILCVYACICEILMKLPDVENTKVDYRICIQFNRLCIALVSAFRYSLSILEGQRVITLSLTKTVWDTFDTQRIELANEVAK